MALPSSGQISMQDILVEKNGGSITATDISLRGLSVNSVADYAAIDITINSASTSKPDGSEPHQMSEFYGYNHSASSTFHETTLTRGSTGGYGFAHSGYWESNIGSLGDATLTYNSRAVTIYRLYTSASSTTATSGSVILDIRDDLDTTSPPNSGWSTMKIYINQSNDSGSPDHTFNRTAATYTSYGNVGLAGAYWTWSVTSSGTPTVFNKYWGTSDNTVNYVVFE